METHLERGGNLQRIAEYLYHFPADLRIARVAHQCVLLQVVQQTRPVTSLRHVQDIKAQFHSDTGDKIDIH